MSDGGDEMERVTLQVPWAPGHTITGPRKHAQRFIDEVQTQRLARTQWPADNRQQMEALAQLFPCFRSGSGDRLPGVMPWDPVRLVQSLNAGGCAASVRHAALFLLSVWNNDDWSDRQFCDPPLKVRRRKGEIRRIGRFDINDAWACWDREHRAAALAWLINPFWP